MKYPNFLDVNILTIGFGRKGLGIILFSIVTENSVRTAFTIFKTEGEWFFDLFWLIPHYT